MEALHTAHIRRQLRGWCFDSVTHYNSSHVYKIMSMHIVHKFKKMPTRWTSARYTLAWWDSPPKAVRVASSVPPQDILSGHWTCGYRLRRDSHSLRLRMPSWKHALHVASFCHSTCLRVHYMQRRVAPPHLNLSLGYRYSRWKTSRCAYPQGAQWLLSTFLDPTASPALRPCTIAYQARCELKTCAILDHRNLATSTEIQHIHCIYHMRKPMCRHHNRAAFDSTKSYIDFLNFSNFSIGHLGSPLFIGTKQKSMLPLYSLHAKT